MNWHAEENPFTVMFRIASGMVVGLIIATVVQVHWNTVFGMEIIRDATLAGSFVGLLTTLGRST